MAGIKQSVSKNKRKADKSSNDAVIKDNLFFKKSKPREKYVFNSDYFTIDDGYASILTILHNQGADDNLGYFWGINLIPRTLSQNVSVRKIEHVQRMPESWVDSHQGKTEGLVQTNQNEVNQDGNLKSRAKLNKQQQDLYDIANELMAGSSYLRVAFRLLVKAPTLDELDEAVSKINRQYKDRFETLFAAPYSGEQRRELSNLMAKADRKEGRNFMFTSEEFAGNYNLVTHGIEDASGEYVGTMMGDVNNSAVLLDIDDYKTHVVISGSNKGSTLSGLKLNNERGVNVWGAKLGMNALMKNHRVVHLVLNGSRVDKIGVNLDDITSIVNMTSGDINLLEMFGDDVDELTIFPAHLNKIVLMAEQAYASTDADRSIIQGTLRDVITKFYVDKGLWAYDAQNNRDSLRLVGLAHDEYPKLPEFVAYLQMEYTAMSKRRARDDEQLHAYNVLRTVFKDMLDNNGDLFNTTTSSIVDKAATGYRVIYDFSSLMRRGQGVAMAQFINALGFAVGTLSEGDVVVLHGVDKISDSVKSYVENQFNTLTENDVRIVYIYGDVGSMVKDKKFNKFDQADYTIMGNMTKTVIDEYEESIKQAVPSTLKQLLDTRDPQQYYLRRNVDNVVFSMDIQLGIDEYEERGVG